LLFSIRDRDRSMTGRAAPRRTLTLVPLVAATYFMVSGGPYGLEELVAGAGYRRALLILLVTPLIWSLPTALMVGELSGAIPDEGGYYAWVRRALGPFWGFQEAWLSLAASAFDMAIYPTLFVLYLARLQPALGGGWPATLLGVALIAACAAWNLRGARSVGGASVWMSVALLSPFAVMVAVAFMHARIEATPPPAAGGAGLLGGMLIAMWNYMGWDNASTIASG
jgi:amino acid transporter